MSPSGSISMRSWSLNYVIPWYPRYSPKRRDIGGYIFGKSAPFADFFIKVSSSSYWFTMNWNMFGPLTPDSVFQSYIWWLLKHLVRRNSTLSLPNIYLLLSIAISLWIRLSSHMFPDSAICFIFLWYTPPWADICYLFCSWTLFLLFIFFY